MIPYAVVKESNADEVKGSVTGIQNFLVFGISALVGLVFGPFFGQTLEGTDNHVAHFRNAASFWMAAVAIALFASLFLRETGRRTSRETPGDSTTPARL